MKLFRVLSSVVSRHVHDHAAIALRFNILGQLAGSAAFAHSLVGTELSEWKCSPHTGGSVPRSWPSLVAYFPGITAKWLLITQFTTSEL